MATYIQVNLGRNIDRDPMTNGQWSNFRSDVIDAMWDLHVDLGGSKLEQNTIETHLGTGYYDGIEEESAHISTLLDTRAEGIDFAQAITSFRRHLRVVAANYGQDSVALIVGSRLIKVPTTGVAFADTPLDELR